MGGSIPHFEKPSVRFFICLQEKISNNYTDLLIKDTVLIVLSASLNWLLCLYIKDGKAKPAE